MSSNYFIRCIKEFKKRKKQYPIDILLLRGGKLYEDFANGTPILSFDVGGMKDHILENTTGLIAENVSSESLAKKIDEFLLNKFNFDASIIREYAMKNFSSQNQVKNYIDLYKSLI